MMQVDISADLSRAREKALRLQNAIDPAAARAANRTVVTVRAEAVKRLRPEYPGLKAGQLRVRMKLTNARRDALVAKVTFSGRRISLYGNFNMRTQGKFGVKFGLAPWRVEDLDGEAIPPEMLARAFRNRLKRGGRATAFARWGKKRYPLAVLVAPGLAKAVVERKIEAALEALGRSRFRAAFAQELRFALSRAA
jgi:hypothetical protein